MFTDEQFDTPAQEQAADNGSSESTETPIEETQEVTSEEGSEEIEEEDFEETEEGSEEIEEEDLRF